MQLERPCDFKRTDIQKFMVGDRIIGSHYDGRLQPIRIKMIAGYGLNFCRVYDNDGYWHNIDDATAHLISRKQHRNAI